MVKVEADLEQTKHMIRRRHDRASEARTGKGKTKEGHGRIMPKEAMAGVNKVGQVITW